jgi:hypothetical protein
LFEEKSQSGLPSINEANINDTTTDVKIELRSIDGCFYFLLSCPSILITFPPFFVTFHFFFDFVELFLGVVGSLGSHYF